MEMTDETEPDDEAFKFTELTEYLGAVATPPVLLLPHARRHAKHYEDITTEDDGGQW